METLDAVTLSGLVVAEAVMREQGTNLAAIALVISLLLDSEIIVLVEEVVLGEFDVTVAFGERRELLAHRADHFGFAGGGVSGFQFRNRGW